MVWRSNYADVGTRLRACRVRRTTIPKSNINGMLLASQVAMLAP